MEDCLKCKWWMPFKGRCLLGRDTKRCDGNPARRGDDELVDRMVDMPPTDFHKVRRRIRHKVPKEISFHKKDEWD